MTSVFLLAKMYINAATLFVVALGFMACKRQEGNVRVEANLITIEAVIKNYHHQTGKWPANYEQAGSIVGENSMSDPWGQPYVIIILEDRYVISSNGRDKVRGTSDDYSRTLMKTDDKVRMKN